MTLYCCYQTDFAFDLLFPVLDDKISLLKGATVTISFLHHKLVPNDYSPCCSQGYVGITPIIMPRWAEPRGIQ